MNLVCESGQYYRITEGACDGCVLRTTSDSIMIDTGFIADMETISGLACCRTCSLYPSETYVQLTPEEIMEIELSR